MSYTLTIESPEKAAWFERQRAKMSAAELGELFVLFLAERVSHAPAPSDEDLALSQWDELVSAGKGRLDKPYQFRRADAYDEELA